MPRDSTDRDQIIARIKACLNTAENDAAVDGEVQNALRFARAMMLRHAIDEAELQDDTDPHAVAAKAELGEDRAYTMSRNLSEWETKVARAVCRLIGTVKWYYSNNVKARTSHGTVEFDRKGKQRIATRITFYGVAEDTSDAAALFREWTLVVASLARLKYGTVFKGSGREYAEGFGEGLNHKLYEIERAERCAAGELIRLPSSSSSPVYVERPKRYKVLVEADDDAPLDYEKVMSVLGRNPSRAREAARLRAAHSLGGPLGSAAVQDYLMDLVATVIEEEDDTVHRGGDLILLQARDLIAAHRKRADEYLEQRGISLGRGSSRGTTSQHDPAARAAGQKDGRAADFSRTVKPKIT